MLASTKSVAHVTALVSLVSKLPNEETVQGLIPVSWFYILLDYLHSHKHKMCLLEVCSATGDSRRKLCLQGLSSIVISAQ